jgi:hypothetical protein
LAIAFSSEAGTGSLEENASSTRFLAAAVSSAAQKKAGARPAFSQSW